MDKISAIIEIQDIHLYSSLSMFRPEMKSDLLCTEDESHFIITISLLNIFNFPMVLMCNPDTLILIHECVINTNALFDVIES